MYDGAQYERAQRGQQQDRGRAEVIIAAHLGSEHGAHYYRWSEILPGMCLANEEGSQRKDAKGAKTQKMRGNLFFLRLCAFAPLRLCVTSFSGSLARLLVGGTMFTLHGGEAVTQRGAAIEPVEGREKVDENLELRDALEAWLALPLDERTGLIEELGLFVKRGGARQPGAASRRASVEAARRAAVILSALQPTDEELQGQLERRRDLDALERMDDDGGTQ